MAESKIAKGIKVYETAQKNITFSSSNVSFFDLTTLNIDTNRILHCDIFNLSGWQLNTPITVLEKSARKLIFYIPSSASFSAKCNIRVFYE